MSDGMTDAYRAQREYNKWAEKNPERGRLKDDIRSAITSLYRLSGNLEGGDMDTLCTLGDNINAKVKHIASGLHRARQAEAARAPAAEADGN